MSRGFGDKRLSRFRDQSFHHKSPSIPPFSTRPGLYSSVGAKATRGWGWGAFESGALTLPDFPGTLRRAKPASLCVCVCFQLLMVLRGCTWSLKRGSLSALFVLWALKTVKKIAYDRFRLFSTRVQNINQPL